jgi:hypothetical protein
VTVVSSISNKCFNILAVDINDCGFSLRLLAIYLVPNVDSTGFDLFFEYFSELLVTNLPLIIVGDFNIDWRQISSTRFGRNFVDVLNANNVLQQAQFSTMPSGKVIDWVLSSDNIVSNCVLNPNLFNSDHFSIKFEVAHQSIANHPNIPSARFFKTDFTALEHLLDNTDWVSLFNSCNDLDVSVFAFIDLCISYFSTVVPTLPPSSAFPSFPSHIKKLSLHRDILFSKLHSSQTVYSLYCKASRDLSNAIAKFNRNRQAKAFRSTHSRDLFQLIAHSCKPRSKAKCEKLMYNDISYIGNESISQGFSAYFFFMFNSHTVHLTYPQFPFSRNTLTLNEFIIFPHMVEKYLRKLKSSASLLPDGLPQLVLKFCPRGFSVPLSFLFNFCLSHSYFPQVWKRSFIIPLLKRDKPVEQLSSYRPISLTSSCAKVFERIIKEQLIDFIEKNNVIPQMQFGFRKGASVVTNLLMCNHDWSCALDSKSSIDVVFIDIAKAFDTLPINVLLIKLSRIGIAGKLLKLLESFLTDRSYSVRFGDHHSPFKPVISGVPQGSVLGPILFSLYLSDIQSAIPSFHNISLKMFADDIKVYSVYKAPSDNSVGNLQSTLNAICDYFRLLHLSIAVEKCEFVHLGSGSSPNYHMNGIPLLEKDEIRDLGLHLSKNFTNHRNVSARFSAALRQQYSLLKAVTVRDPIILVRCYKTYVLPIIEFASPVWSPHLLLLVRKIETLQRNFTKTVFNRCFRFDCRENGMPNYNERLLRLNLLPLVTRRVVADLILAFKIIKGFTTLSFSSFYSLRRSFGRRSNILYNFKKSRSRTTSHQHSFANRTINYFLILQNIDPGLLSCDSPATFKCRLLKLDLTSLLSLKY